MNNRIKMRPFSLQEQQGAVVIAVVLVLLVVLTMIGLTSAKKGTIETKMTTNALDRQKAFIAAGSAVKFAWANLNTTGFEVTAFVSNCNESGIYDLRDNADSSCQGNGLAKTKSVWNTMKASGTSAWNDAEKRKNITNTAIQTTMGLTVAPQYVMGIRSAIERKGTEGSYCVPVSIMGAGTGGTEHAKALVEVNAIPRAGCFKSLVQ
ncbi:MAG TPA: hypothetical protein ENJ33_06530 [Thiothrix sp.]|nr:hypothetical protein [Thiothrix sp.]